MFSNGQGGGDAQPPRSRNPGGTTTAGGTPNVNKKSTALPNAERPSGPAKSEPAVAAGAAKDGGNAST